MNRKFWLYRHEINYLSKIRILCFVLFLLFAQNKNPKPKSKNKKVSDISIVRNKHLKVLIIDDEDRFRNSMSFNLKRQYGAQVKAVESGSGAIKNLKAGNSYDIIFLDIMMPKMDGIEAYYKLREIDSRCRIAIMSAYSNSKEWKIAEDLGVDLLSKPIPSEKMTQILFTIGD